jgi:membrane-bound PQQ-dependent dehydrogenase (glucose/quinate/shikimate family)
MRVLAIGAALSATLLIAACKERAIGVADSNDHIVAGWSHYGGDEGGSRFSPLTQINANNVGALQIAWTYHSGDLKKLPSPLNLPAFEATPILAGDTLYLCSPLNKIIALNAETGVERWHYSVNPDTRNTYLVTCRGVTYYHDKTADVNAACRARIFSGTMDGRLLALDAATGKRCEAFGSNGEIDLKKDAGGEIHQGEYVVTSAPVIAGDAVITGALVVDNARRNVASGVVRAFDVHTGALRWAWDPVPQDWPKSDAGYTPGSPNAWAPFSVDNERHLVFIPTGNPANDLYSAERRSLDYYGSSVVALNSDTGEVVWHFQTVHHDIWDYDVGSQPVLFDFPGPNGPIPALAQATKQGFIFVLNRETGAPLLPIEERPVPQGGVAPTALSPTQPYPVITEPIVQEQLSEDDMWGFSWFDRRDCVQQFRAAKYAGRFTPPATQPTIQYPGNNGGPSWGSVSWDPLHKLLITNAARVPAMVQLFPRAQADAQQVHDKMEGEPYGATRSPMLSFLGAPCNRPPWGVLAAYDMTTGKRAWEIPLGSTRDVAPWPLWLNLGVPNQGGSLITAGGLTFIGAATDSYLRAFKTESGELLWQGRLPGGGQATPMTYRLRPDGKQFIVISAGGHKYLRTQLSDAVVAFTLPQ